MGPPLGPQPPHPLTAQLQPPSRCLPPLPPPPPQPLQHPPPSSNLLHHYAGRTDHHTDHSLHLLCHTPSQPPPPSPLQTCRVVWSCMTNSTGPCLLHPFQAKQGRKACTTSSLVTSKHNHSTCMSVWQLQPRERRKTVSLPLSAGPLNSLPGTRAAG